MEEHISPPRQGLYDPQNEHDACGVGFVVDLKGRKSTRSSRRRSRSCSTSSTAAPAAARRTPATAPGSSSRSRTTSCPRSAPRPGHQAPGGRAVRRRHRLPAQRSGQPGRLRAPLREGGPRRGAALPRLARRPDRQLDARPDRAAGRSRSSSSSSSARHPSITDDDAFERKLYVIRRRARHAVRRLEIPEKASFYIPSLSSRTIVYKGMLNCDQLTAFYLDLQDERVESALALVHSRFSTNTFPNWSRAHPYRMIAHNGEINTLRGNVNWMHARESMFAVEAVRRRPARSASRSSTPTAATRGCSTTCSSCSSSPGGRCRTR